MKYYWTADRTHAEFKRTQDELEELVGILHDLREKSSSLEMRLQAKKTLESAEKALAECRAGVDRSLDFVSWLHLY